MAEHDGDMTRRVLLRGAALTGVAAPVLAACGSDGGGTTTGEGGSGGSGSGSSGGVKASVPTSDVPVGGGTILADQEVVVTQPSKGDYQAFSAICTHQGCLVQSITDGTINCPCHGSRFSVKDGSVVQGPATTPLKSFDATVQGGDVEVS